jgi:hypothetical protein
MVNCRGYSPKSRYTITWSAIMLQLCLAVCPQCASRRC